MTTLVTSFIVCNTRPDRSISDYLALGRKLIDCKLPMVLFMDDTYIDQVEPMEHVHLIPVNKNSLELNAYRDQIQFNVITDNPRKDTVDYRMLMCSKTEFMSKAAQLNPFQTEHFVWVDFGIHHLFSGKDSLFTEGIHTLQYEGDQVRIGRIWDPSLSYFKDPNDIYRRIAWYFAGGVFGGKREALLEFESRMKKKCIEIIQERKSLMWEVNVWRLLYLDHPQLFSLYECNHNPSILLNYKLE
jgi:hypothetical protein